MGDCELKRFGNPDELARAAAAEWLTHIAQAGQGPRSYCVALAGGGIAGRFFQAVAWLAGGKNSVPASVHFFWSDERCVAPQSDQSNFRLAYKNMLEPLRIGDSQIHRIRGEEAPPAAAAQAETELRRWVPSASNGQPVLDLVFLGMGPDGHVASLFPGEPEAARNSPQVFRPVIGPKPPPQRITMGYPAIAAAREVWLLASGPAKENAFQESLSGSGATPLARVIKSRPTVRIYTDLAPPRS